MTGGIIWGLWLQDDAVMHVFAGTPGGDQTTVRGNAYLNVAGGGSFSGAFGGLTARDSALVDLRSGAALPSGVFSYTVMDFAMIRLFGTNFLVDGMPDGPANITALAGGAPRTGTVSGVLESGDAISVPFEVSGNGIIRLVPEPGTGVLLSAALAATIAAHRRRRAAVERGSAATCARKSRQRRACSGYP